MASVHLLYVTDPACPWSWAAEPAVRRVLTEFADEVAITYVMGGLARDLTEPLQELAHAVEASAWSGMPVDARLWADRPPRSTYPACLAVKAAAEQGRDAELLRVLREGLMLDREPLDHADALEAAGRRVPGMDLARYGIDLRSNAIAEAFAADLDRAADVPEAHRSPRRGRAILPSIRVGEDRWLSGRIAPDALAAAVREAGAQGGAPPDVPAALERFGRHGRVAAAEVAAVCGIPRERASAELWRLAAEWRARPERVGASETWRAAT